MRPGLRLLSEAHKMTEATQLDAKQGRSLVAIGMLSSCSPSTALTASLAAGISTGKASKRSLQKMPARNHMVKEWLRKSAKDNKLLLRMSIMNFSRVVERLRPQLLDNQDIMWWSVHREPPRSLFWLGQAIPRLDWPQKDLKSYAQTFHIPQRCARHRTTPC